MSLVACEAPKDGGAAGSAPAQPAPPADGSGNTNDPNQPSQPAQGLQDHHTRSPGYGTNPTQAECEMLSHWQDGGTETWMFGTAYAHAATSQAEADDYNAHQFLRFDRDGITWRSWNGTRWVNHFLNHMTWELGPDCEVEVMGSLTGVGHVWWQGVQL